MPSLALLPPSRLLVLSPSRVLVLSHSRVLVLSHSSMLLLFPTMAWVLGNGEHVTVVANAPVSHALCSTPNASAAMTCRQASAHSHQ